MKNISKILSILIVAIVLLSALSISAFAESEGYNISFNEDFSESTLNNSEKYIKINASTIFENYSGSYNAVVQPSSENDKPISNVNLAFNEDESIIRAEIEFKNGDTTTSYYAHSNAYQSIMELNTVKPDELYIKDYPYRNEEVVIPYYIIEDCLENGSSESFLCYNVNRSYPICVENKGFYKIIGFILFTENKRYYLDCEQSEISNPASFQIYTAGDITAVELKGEEIDTLLGIKDEEEENTLGIKIFFILVCGVLPFAFFIVSFIFYVKKKGIYKKFWKAICLLCLIEISIFVLTYIYIF